MTHLRLAVGIAVTVLASGQPAAAAEIRPSETCGSCHATIHSTWLESAHARSLDNPVFLESLRATEAASGRKLALLCLDCHAPLVALNGDTELGLRVTWEGVNCEVCHSLVSVDLTGRGPRRVLEPGPVKRGPVPDASDHAHGVAYSELHSKAEACAWCHEYVSAEGVPVLSTYSEWRASQAAARGVTCQGCHMGATRAEVVDPRVDRDASASINLHRVPGGHSLDQLHQALALSIRPRREGDSLALAVGVRNKGAGHAVPTGMPGRRVILDVAVDTSRGGSFAERRVYERTFADAQGNPVVRDRDHFVPGVSLRQDTRLQPDEEREEAFRFPLAPDATAYITVRLHYEHSPLGGERGRTWITFFSEKRTVAAETGGAAPPG
jgi:hypothetical protein